MAREELAKAEGELRRTQEETGLIKVDDQAKVVIEAAGRVQAEIAAREIGLRAMRTFATDKNPDVLRANQELEGFRAQLNRLEQSQLSGRGKVLVPMSKVPELGLEFTRKLRELKYREAVHELLVKQYESARIDESKGPALIQVIDKAVVPERRSSPRRVLITIVLAFVGMITGFAFSLFDEWAARNPIHHAKVLQLVRSVTTWKTA